MGYLPADRQGLATSMSERELMAHVTDAAHKLGWRVYHTRFSWGSNVGFPDLVLAREGKLAFVELKAEDGRLTAHQEAWLDELSVVEKATEGRVRAMVWRPRDWLYGDVVKFLATGRNTQERSVE